MLNLPLLTNHYYRPYEDNVCTSCLYPCYTCANDMKWTSCQSGYYFQPTNAGGTVGDCVLKDQPDGTVNIFVSPNLIETTADGSYGNPFGHIAKALEYANGQVADMSGNPNINVYLLGGDNHFMTTNIEHYNYDLTKSDKTSLDQNIVIQPAFCDQTLGGHSFTTGDTDCIASTTKITVYYKMANSFYFIVPNSLTIKNIIAKM